MTTTEDVFIPDNQAVSDRLKLIFEIGEASRLAPMLDNWKRDGLMQAKRDLHRYFHASRRQFEAQWKEHSTAQPNARAAAELGRRYRHQYAALNQVCTEVEDEIDRALERNQEEAAL